MQNIGSNKGESMQVPKCLKGHDLVNRFNRQSVFRDDRGRLVRATCAECQRLYFDAKVQKRLFKESRLELIKQRVANANK